MRAVPPTIVDPHVHQWHPRETPRAVSPLVRALGWSPRLLSWVARRAFPKEAVAFFASPEHFTRPYLPADFDADTAHHRVEGFVHIEASWEGEGPLGPVAETRWLAQLDAVGAGRVDAIVGHVDLGLGRDAKRVLSAHLEASERVRGIRDVLSWHPSPAVFDGASGPNRMNESRWREGFEQLAAPGLSFEATVYEHQLDELSALARAYPKQPIMLCHAGTPIGVGGPFAGVGETPTERDRIRNRWEASLARLAENTNVSVKLSGLAMPCCGFGWERRREPPSVDEVCDALGPLIELVLAAFGAERCAFASNFPIDKVSLSYARLYDAYDALVAQRSEAERAALFAGTARRFYRLDAC